MNDGSFEIVCAVLDDTLISLYTENEGDQDATPPYGHIYPDDVGPLARRILDALAGHT